MQWLKVMSMTGILGLLLWTSAQGEVYQIRLNEESPSGTYNLTIPKNAVPSKITVNGHPVFNQGRAYYQDLPGSIIIAKSAYPVPALYFVSGIIQDVNIDWITAPAKNDHPQLIKGGSSFVNTLYQVISSLFALVFVIVLVFIKQDFESTERSFNLTLITGVIIAVYLYLNTSHPYLHWPQFSFIILKVHVFVISLTTILLLALTDRFFGLFKSKIYLFTPAMTAGLLLLLPIIMKKENFEIIVSSLIPNALITLTAAVIIFYQFIFHPRFKNEMTIFPVLITGAAASIVSLVDTFESSFSRVGQPPISAYGFFLFYITLTLTHIVRNKKIKINQLVVHEKLAEIAEQVAHDIRSPLAALKMQINQGQAPDTMLITVERINNILLDLEAKHGDSQSNNLKAENLNLLATLDVLTAEKKSEFPHINVILNIAPDIKISCNKSVFSRIISNLINNSIEASDGKKAEIIIEAERSNNNFVEIKLSDRGSGMTEDVLQKVQERHFSHGKEKGRGLGLTYVAEMVKSWNGLLRLQSNPGEGTIVFITVPEAIPAKSIVLIDNEELMVLGWTLIAMEKNIHFKGFHSVEAFEQDYKCNEKSYSDETIFYIDYELGNINGIEAAGRVHQYGFNHIYLFTGRRTLDVSDYPYIKGIVSKEFKLL